jgi:hypothetical protein
MRISTKSPDSSSNLNAAEEPPGSSERTRLCEPLACELQIRPYPDHVIVPVVVQDAELVTVGEGGQEDVDRRHPVVPSARQLPLSVDRSPLDCVIDGCPGKGKKLSHEITMILRRARGITGLEHEREASHDLSGLGGGGHFFNPRRRQLPVAEAGPGRVVQQKGTDQLRAQPVRRTSSAALGSTRSRRVRIR